MSYELRRCDIEVNKPADLERASKLAVDYSASGIVVPHNLIDSAMIMKGMTNSKHMIIAQIDWPTGRLFKTDKFRGCAENVLRVNSIEIVITPNKSSNDTTSEIKYINDFVRKMYPVIDIRFVIDIDSGQEPINTILSSIKKSRLPSLIRINKNLAYDGQDVIKYHQDNISKILEVVDVPVKISGSVDFKVLMAITNNTRFGVNVTQAQSIIKDYKDHLASNLEARIAKSKETQKENVDAVK